MALNGKAPEFLLLLGFFLAKIVFRIISIYFIISIPGSIPP